MYVCEEEEKDMAVAEIVKVDVKNSFMKSLKEVEDLRNGKLPKHSYKDMMNRIRET